MIFIWVSVGFKSHETLTQLIKGEKMVDYTERKQQLIEENEWLPKAIEMLNMRLIDRGFNCENKWLGYYDEYVLHYEPRRYQNYEGEWEKMDWGKLEIHEKHEVFNPYKYCGGKGTEYRNGVYLLRSLMSNRFSFFSCPH